MPATPITDPVTGESLVGTEPQLRQQLDPGQWRQRLNLFTGRALSVSALDGEQKYRGGLLATLGLSVTPGTVNGLGLTIDLSGADPMLVVNPGYGITASGQDVVLNSALKTHLSTLTVIDIEGNQRYSFHQSVGDPTNSTNAGILLLQPVVAQVSGQFIDTGTGPVEVSGNLDASCDQDPTEYAFEDWQIADAVRLVYLPWPAGVPALAMPALSPASTWRNRLAYAIFEAEALLGPDDQLPWAMLGLPVALIGFDPGGAWESNTAFTVGQFVSDSNSNIQTIETAGTTAGTEPKWNTVYGGTTTDGGVTWRNDGLAWKPLFVDCSAVVRAGGLPRRRNVFPSQPAPLRQWQSKIAFEQGDFIIDTNNNVQLVQTAGKTGGPQPQWKAVFGQTTGDGTVTWIENGPATWRPQTVFASGQFVFDANGNMQHVLIAGTSGQGEPTWNGVYLPTTDGSVTWMNNGSGNPPVIQPALAQARINQLSEQLSQAMTGEQTFSTLADIFSTLPPSGILPAAALDFEGHRAPWLPPNWKVSAAPVYLEELESVLLTGMLLDPVSAASSAPEDQTLLEQIEVLVPLPDALYDRNILQQETVAPIFAQEVAKATEARNLTLQKLEAVQQQINTLYTGIGPNLPANPNLIDINTGLTPDELTGRDAPPPYVPPANASFGTMLQSTWAATVPFAVGQFVIDSNGSIQVAQTAGKTGTADPSWNANIGGTTTDGDITWINNGALSWQPDTAYTKGQFVVDPTGFMQIVTTAGVSASSQPSWTQPEVQGQSVTLDGIVWQAAGKGSWQPDFPYASGDLILDSNGNIQIVQTAGISGDSAPTWNQNNGQTTQDSGVTWTNLGNSPWQATTHYSKGQAIVDSNGNIETVVVGGTSGGSQPAWGTDANATTVDASVSWLSSGPLTWQPSKNYLAGQLILDSNGNLELATVLNADGNAQPIGTQATSGMVTPTWSTTPGGTVLDGTITWMYLPFFSTDFAAIKAAAAQGPYTSTYTDFAGNSHTISLLSANDINTLETNGIQSLITSLNTRISKANDLLDTAFLTVQTDIYRYRQNVLGASAATALATSPVLAAIATGETAATTADNLKTYLNTLQPPPSQTSNYTPPAPTFTPPVIHPISPPVVLGGGHRLFSQMTIAPKPGQRSPSLRTRAVISKLGGLTPINTFNNPVIFNNPGILNNPGTFNNNPVIFNNPGGVINNPGIFNNPGGIINNPGIFNQPPVTPVLNTGGGIFAGGLGNTITAGGNQFTVGGGLQFQRPGLNFVDTGLQGGPAQIVQPGQNTTATPTDITSQSPVAGAQLNIRTLTIAERLQQSPSQEAMFYSIGNRLNFMLALQALETDLNLVVDDLPFLVDAQVPDNPAGLPATPGPIPVETHTFSEWLTDTQHTFLNQIQSPYLAKDPAEATLFSVGIRVVEQHTALLRALENRVHQYSEFVGICSSALNSMQSDIQQAQVFVSQLQNKLAQDRQNVAFTTALLGDETIRVNRVNAQRQQVLRDSVQLVAYTRARTLEPTDTVPSRQLVPANITNPVPACVQQSVAIPPELRELVGQLREAPVNWMPSIAAEVGNLERPVLLQQLALSAQSRAAQLLQLPMLPSSAAGEPGVYKPAISKLFNANQQVFRTFQMQRASLQPAALSSLSWSMQVAQMQSLIAINDLIAAETVHAEISNAVARLIQQISSVATCLYTRASIALPIERLGWAEYLRGDGLSIQLQSLAVLPGWNQLTYIDRQQMQMLVDWLFMQIDTGNSSAMAFMSDLVRTAILLASDVPIDNIIPANVIFRIQPAVGGMVSLSLPSDRVSSGMYVNLYSGGTLAARGIVSDLDTSTVRATVTDVFTPGKYLETTDTAHFTTMTPQAIAMRPLLMGR